MNINEDKQYISQIDPLVEMVRERARNLYLTRKLLCTEAVVVALNQGLNGGLAESQAVAMAAPFCAAFGESGCICGALSGAVMVSGLFLGNRQPHRHRKLIRDSARLLHDEFKTSNGATCCRLLSQKVRHDKKAHFLFCAGLTAQAAELAARLILRERPEVLSCVNHNFLYGRQSKISVVLMRLRQYLFS